MSDSDQYRIFKLIQDYLKPCSVIIWGSGGTVPLGIPSMEQLKEHLGIKEKGNIETILDNLIEDEETYKDYKSKIFRFMDKHDKKLREKIKKDASILQPLNSIIKRLYKARPENINVITTNYDCVLEYCFSINGYPYTDGFSGREFSRFDEDNFRKRNYIKLLKVHGSLRWTEEKLYSYFNEDMEAIIPAVSKYQKSHQPPFRTLIHKSDEIISHSKSILSIGFGFNDEHVTPKIDEVMEKDGTIVIVAKKATEATMKKVKKFNKPILIEKGSDSETKFSFKENGTLETIALEGKFWELAEFIKLLLNK